MWDPFTNSLFFLPALAVFGASLVGSGHCLAMCGGLASYTAGSVKSLTSYHIGRLVGYVGLGLLAGWIGEKTFVGTVASWISAILLFALFVTMAVRIFFSSGETIIVPRFFLKKIERALSTLLPRAPSQPAASWGVGVLTAFLPCGWLHTFVAAAVATHHPVRGGVLLFFFWLGTLPSLSLGGLFFQKLALVSSRKKIYVNSALLLLAAFGALGIKVAPLFRPPASGTSCHTSTPSESGE